MKQYIYCKADYNDGDYIYSQNEINPEELELLKLALSKVPRKEHWKTKEKLKSFRWETNDQGDTAEELIEQGILTKEEANVIYNFVPSNEYGIHSVESMKLMIVTEEKELL